jgi:hypothetical protein
VSIFNTDKRSSDGSFFDERDRIERAEDWTD